MASVLDTSLDQQTDTVDALALDALLSAGFPTPDLVSAAAGAFTRSDRSPLEVGYMVGSSLGIAGYTGWGAAEGPSFFVNVTPGVVRLVAEDQAKRHRRENRDALRTPLLGVDPSTGEVTGDVRRRITSGREVKVWSAKSRARMVRVMASTDWRPLFRSGVPVMVTLTYPGEWSQLVPNGQAAKRHVEAFKERWRRRWGAPIVGAWKLEFQRRGAPHFHLLVGHPPVSPAEFRAWLSAAWFEVVGSGDLRHLQAGTGVDMREGARMKDVKRVAVYFAGHSMKGRDGKEYQHAVPAEWQGPGDGPGRFWGLWGLDQITSGVEVSPADFIALRRLLRRWAAARGRRLCCGGRIAGGFAVVNDGPAFAFALARALALLGT